MRSAVLALLLIITCSELCESHADSALHISVFYKEEPKSGFRLFELLLKLMLPALCMRTADCSWVYLGGSKFGEDTYHYTVDGYRYPQHTMDHRMLYMLRDPRDVTVSRCHHEHKDLGGKAGPFTTALLDRCLKTNFVNTAMWVKLRELFIANELQHTHYICYEQIASADLGAKRAGIERVAGVLGFGGITQAEAGMLINATSIDNAAVGAVNWQGVRSGGQMHFTDYDLSLSLVGWMNSTYYQLETMHPSLCTQHRHAAGLF
ncbi:hypothetical protein B484DRAFT_429302 [Ochromonadaceae sp. CCMP2298]|nr:hypothetical protein B484DRAFT_429302 [Ochromonadaceae sp. CCMP2298]